MITDADEGGGEDQSKAQREPRATDPTQPSSPEAVDEHSHSHSHGLGEEIQSDGDGECPPGPDSSTELDPHNQGDEEDKDDENLIKKISKIENIGQCADT